MPIRRTYKGRVVTRIQWTPHGVELTFANERPGERHERRVVSQDDWKLHGTERYEATPSERQSQGK